MFLSSCASRQWLTDARIDAENKTPEQLIDLLGPPAKIDTDQQVRLHKGKVQEYRYFVLDRSGEVQYRRYFYYGEKWLTESLPAWKNEKSHTFRVIDPTESSSQRKLSDLYKARPDLRP